MTTQRHWPLRSSISVHKVVLDPKLWLRVYLRDGGRCVARKLDPDIGPCRDRWGEPVKLQSDGTMRRRDVTFAHIKMSPGGPRVDDEMHAVCVCWGHHVMGRGDDAMWAARSRGLRLIRSYLRRLYGHDYQ